MERFSFVRVNIQLSYRVKGPGISSGPNYRVPAPHYPIIFTSGKLVRGRNCEFLIIPTQIHIQVFIHEKTEERRSRIKLILNYLVCVSHHIHPT